LLEAQSESNDVDAPDVVLVSHPLGPMLDHRVRRRLAGDLAVRGAHEGLRRVAQVHVDQLGTTARTGEIRLQLERPVGRGRLPWVRWR